MSRADGVTADCVAVPRELARPVLRALLRDLREQVRANGLTLPPGLAELARALHLAAESTGPLPPAASARGSDPAPVGRMITTDDAARLIGCSSRWVRQLLADGRLAGHQVDGHGTWLVDPGSVRGMKRG